MISLKLSKKDKKDMYPVEATNSDGPDFPWGFSLHIEGKYVDKLGLSGMSAGQEVSIAGVGKIIGVNIEDTESDRTESLRIQIQKVEIEPQESAEKRARKEIAKEVYGK